MALWVSPTALPVPLNHNLAGYKPGTVFWEKQVNSLITTSSFLLTSDSTAIWLLFPSLHQNSTVQGLTLNCQTQEASYILNTKYMSLFIFSLTYLQDFSYHLSVHNFKTCSSNLVPSLALNTIFIYSVNIVWAFTICQTSCKFLRL